MAGEPSPWGEPIVLGGVGGVRGEAEELICGGTLLPAGETLPSEKPAVLALAEPSMRGGSPQCVGGALCPWGERFVRGDRPLSGGGGLLSLELVEPLVHGGSPQPVR